MQKPICGFYPGLKHSHWLLFSLCILLGVLLGSLFAAGSDSYLYSLMRQGVLRPTSIVVSLILAVFPFFISAYGAWIRRKEILLWVTFLSAFIYGFFGCLLMGAFGSAGWLMQILMQLTQSISLPLLCWFSLRHFPQQRNTLALDHAICLFIVSALTVFDSFVVSPFVAELIEIYLGR